MKLNPVPLIVKEDITMHPSLRIFEDMTNRDLRTAAREIFCWYKTENIPENGLINKYIVRLNNANEVRIPYEDALHIIERYILGRCTSEYLILSGSDDLFK